MEKSDEDELCQLMAEDMGFDGMEEVPEWAASLISSLIDKGWVKTFVP